MIHVISKLSKQNLLTILISFSFGLTPLMAQIDMSLIGSWSGEVIQPGFPTYLANMTINDLVIGEMSGQTDYPTLPCSGSNALVDNIGIVHVFSETITSSPGVCIDGQIEIYKIATDSIHYTWLDTAGTAFVTGVLIRSTTGIDYLNRNQQLDIFPNPFATSAKIQLTSPINNAVIRVSTLLGQEVCRIENVFGEEILLSRNNLLDGLYVLQIIEDNQTIAVKKFMIADN
jgi:hypothetical protein